MKKIIFSIPLLFTLFTFSQNSKIKYGFQAGLNYSNFRGYTIPSLFDQVYSESPAFAYLGGIHIEYQLKEQLSLKLELNYERKSQKAANSIEIRNDFEEPSQVYNFTSKKNYDYLILPILLKYNFNSENSFFVNGGPFLGYLLKSKLTNNLNVTDFNTDDIDTTKDNKKIDYGLSFGFGKIFEISNNKAITIELRENLGLSNTPVRLMFGMVEL